RPYCCRPSSSAAPFHPSGSFCLLLSFTSWPLIRGHGSPELRSGSVRDGIRSHAFGLSCPDRGVGSLGREFHFRGRGSFSREVRRVTVRSSDIRQGISARHLFVSLVSS